MMNHLEQERMSPAAAGTAAQAPQPTGQPAPPASTAATPATSLHLPADQGLSGLGILMDLGGSVFVLGWVLAAIIAGIAALDAGGATSLIALFMVLGVVRASLQARAGRAIVMGHRSGALVPLRRYVQVGLIQAASTVVLLGPSSGFVTALLIAAALAVWPLAMLFLVLRTPIARTAGALGIDDDSADNRDLDHSLVGENRYKLPLPADNGYESLAVVMFLLAAVGAAVLLLVCGIALPEYLDSLGSGSNHSYGMGRYRASSSPSTWTMVLLAMLVIRSGFHLRAAIIGLRGATTADFEAAATRYVHIGVYVAYLGAGCVAMTSFFSPGHLNMGNLLVSTMAVFWCLHLWPRITGLFVRERSLTELLERSHDSHRAQDKGLTALGWVLLAFGLFEIVSPLFSLGILDLALSAGRSADAGSIGELGGKAIALLVAVPLISGVAKVFAGVELVRMTPRYKQAAWVSIVVGLAFAAMAHWDSLRTLGNLSVGSLSIGTVQALLLHVGGLTVALLLPITTLVLIRRTDKIPGATAMFRQ